jgi:uncharacterized protein
MASALRQARGAIIRSAGVSSYRIETRTWWPRPRDAGARVAVVRLPVRAVLLAGVMRIIFIRYERATRWCDLNGSQTMNVTIGESEGRGRGVFAARRFEPGETIEVCPVVALSEAEARTLDRTALYDYYFGWGHDGKAAAIGLGFCSLYNHSITPNAEHHKNLAGGTITIVARETIAPGQEIFIRYNTGMGRAEQPVWFEVR